MASDPIERMAFGPLMVTFDATVLRPRPWTAAQGEWAAELIATGAAPDGPLLELCSGAGQIGLVAAVRSGRSLVQVDASESACRFARANADAAGAAVAGRVSIRAAPFERALADDERFAIVIADPPYIPTAEVDRFPEDPHTAIDGGPDGLQVLDACLQTAAAHLLPGGHVLAQVRGQSQAETLARLCAELHVAEVRTYGPDVPWCAWSPLHPPDSRPVACRCFPHAACG
jgi:methylase of polypeptide subunit release factors